MDQAKKILVVEDESHLAKGLQFNLEREGYEVVVAGDGKAALECMREQSFDLMILDLMLPKMGGIEVAKNIRQTDTRFPILMLSAKSTEADRSTVLAAGADDYLAKPYHLPELLLRVKGILRRWDWYKQPIHGQEIFHFGKMWIDFTSGKAKGCSGEFLLTVKEAQVMKLLISKKGQVVTREDLLETVWGYDRETETRTVDNFIARLRKHFEKKPQKPEFIVTVREKGYQFNADS